jgi:hypothetical protein
MMSESFNKILNIGSAFSQRFLTAAMSNRFYKFERVEDPPWGRALLLERGNDVPQTERYLDG